MKRTRPIKKYFLTIPRVAISEPGVYQLKMKVSQVIIEKVKELPAKKVDEDRWWDKFAEVASANGEG